MRDFRIVSNNPLAQLAADDVWIKEPGAIKVLEKARDLTHLGYRLLTHPLAGSVKPNENIYKSIVISAKPGEPDARSVTTAEDCLEKALRMLREKPYGSYTEKILDDMKLIDLSLLKVGLESLNALGVFELQLNCFRSSSLKSSAAERNGQFAYKE